MARFVVLRFEDNKEAEQFVGELQQYDRWDGGGFSSTTILGLFAIPTKFCECPRNDHAKPIRITRGERLGWWVDRNCGKPLRGSWQSPHNLLQPPEVRHARPVGDPHWRDPEFMFQPKLTWIHREQLPGRSADAPPSDDATTTPEQPTDAAG